MKSKSLGTSDEMPLQEDGFAREKEQLREAWTIKALKGSIVWEKVSCGKRSCSVCGGSQLRHGPYSYLHYYSNGKVKRKYLSKAIADLVACPKKELEDRLKEIESSETTDQKSTWDAGELES